MLEISGTRNREPRAEVFAYGHLSAIAASLERAIEEVVPSLVMLWVVQRGELVAAIDLLPDLASNRAFDARAVVSAAPRLEGNELKLGDPVELLAETRLVDLARKRGSLLLEHLNPPHWSLCWGYADLSTGADQLGCCEYDT